MHTHSISISDAERLCINCGHYRQHYRKGDGKTWVWIPTSSGTCLLKKRQRCPLERPCRNFQPDEKVQRRTRT